MATEQENLRVLNLWFKVLKHCVDNEPRNPTRALRQLNKEIGTHIEEKISRYADTDMTFSLLKQRKWIFYYAVLCDPKSMVIGVRKYEGPIDAIIRLADDFFRYRQYEPFESE